VAVCTPANAQLQFGSRCQSTFQNGWLPNVDADPICVDFDAQIPIAEFNTVEFYYNLHGGETLLLNEVRNVPFINPPLVFAPGLEFYRPGLPLCHRESPSLDVAELRETGVTLGQKTLIRGASGMSRANVIFCFTPNSERRSHARLF